MGFVSAAVQSFPDPMRPEKTEVKKLGSSEKQDAFD
jgi:hypothetical protein